MFGFFKKKEPKPLKIRNVGKAWAIYTLKDGSTLTSPVVIGVEYDGWVIRALPICRDRVFRIKDAYPIGEDKFIQASNVLTIEFKEESFEVEERR